MHCTDCSQPIESCSCSFFGGRRGSAREAREREFWTRPANAPELLARAQEIVERRKDQPPPTEEEIIAGGVAFIMGRDEKASAMPSDAVAEELKRAIAKFPTWPTDPLHAVAVLGEEFGELTKAVLQSVYEPHKATRDDVRSEAVQTAAMALRFLASLDRYEYAKGAQHEQAV